MSTHTGEGGSRDTNPLSLPLCCQLVGKLPGTNGWLAAEGPSMSIQGSYGHLTHGEVGGPSCIHGEVGGLSCIHGEVGRLFRTRRYAARAIRWPSRG